MKTQLLTISYVLAAATCIAGDVSLVPDKVPCAVADRQDAQIPDRAHLTGMIGTRIDNNVVHRLLAVDTDGLLAGFRHRPGAQAWCGEHVGKWLHAATLAWVYSGNAELRAKLDHVASELVKCQLDDGYLGTYLPKDYWTSWDVWVHKYNLIGLITYMRYTGNREPLAACRKMGDLLCKTFGNEPGKRDIIKAGEHVGMAPTSVLEPMVWLYRLTGDEKYGDFCKYVLCAWEQPKGPHIVSRLLDGKGVNQVGNGKAYEMLSSINGLLEWYRSTGNPEYLKAAINAWEDIVAKRLYITGTASAGEHFHSDYELPNTGNVGETCVTVTWLQLNAHLLRLTGQARYAEQLERVVYNQLCGAQKPDGKAWGYYVEMEGKKPYTTSTNCCLSSGPRGMALIPTFAITTDADGVVVNLYDPATAALHLRGGAAVKLAIETEYPAKGKIAIAVDPAEEHEFALKLRIPAWCARPSLRVNGEAVDGKRTADGYTALKRSWKPGDKIELALPLEPRLVLGDHTNLNKAAVLYGPLVLAADTALSGDKQINAIKLASRDLAELDVSPKPLPEQLFLYVKGILSLDLGFSFRQQAPVSRLIMDRLPATLLLTISAFAISLVLGIFFGVLAARWAGTWADTAITVAALLFYATPIFWIALMAILLFSVEMDWLPSFGYETVGANYTGFAHVLDVGAHLIMPAVTIGLFFMATYTRMTRASMLEVKRLDFVKTARAKGLSDGVIQRRHVLRNALLPVVTMAGLHSGTLIGGAVLTETVFAWPGIGRLMYEALLQRDYNLLLGVFVVCSAMVLILNLVTDLVYRMVDPRIDFSA